MDAERRAYDELCHYTLAHGDDSFLHQHVVDAFAAQTAADSDKPIRLTFALVGLYLHVEKGFTGKQVQRAHMNLARHEQTWPTFPLPPDRGMVRAGDVLAAAPGPKRDEMIHHWCESVWAAYCAFRPRIQQLLDEAQ